MSPNIVNGCLPGPVGIVVRGQFGLDEAVPAVGNAFGFGEDVVVDDRVTNIRGRTRRCMVDYLN
jgi:hypothetical protein